MILYLLFFPFDSLYRVLTMWNIGLYCLYVLISSNIALLALVLATVLMEKLYMEDKYVFFFLIIPVCFAIYLG